MGASSKFKPKAIRRNAADRHRLQRDFEARVQEEQRKKRAECEQGQHGSHRRHDCPNLPCNFCKKEGHAAPTCPIVRNRHKAGTPTPLKQTPDSIQGPKWQATAREILPCYYCPGMSSMDIKHEGETEDVYVAPSIKFPDLRLCMTDLVNTLREKQVDVLKYIDYRALFEVFGPCDQIIDDALALIEPEVLDLQGKDLTPDLFYQTQTRQFIRQELWSEGGGYVEAVLDDRHADYIRFYPGQSSRLDLRIARAHARKIANGNTQALHYFVMARGRGHRYARFLKLWRCSSVSTSTMAATTNSKHYQLSRTEMLQNLLEMMFCCAFQSLPATVLTEYFGNGIYSNVGLSNLPPLFQGVNVPAHIRARYLEFHQESPDADIAAFTGVRKTQNIENSNAKSRAQSWLRGDYRQAVEQLLEDLNFEPASLRHFSGEADSTQMVSVKVQDEIEKLSLEAKICDPQQIKVFASPLGNPQAKIGVVLCSESEIIENNGQGLQPLRGLKLTEENSIVWTSSFERMGSGPSRCRPDSKHLDRIDSLNYSVITSSGIRVVLLCGLKAQQDIIRAFKRQSLGPQLTGPHELFLRNYCYNVWFLTSGKDITKMFIESPEPFLVDVLRNVTQARRLKDVFGLTSALTDERIKFNVWENACFHAALMAQVRREKGGAGPLTAASLGIVYRDWLHYRGFVDVADIEELERTTGNLTVALLQIRVILSHKARGFKSILDEDYLGYRGKFDETAYKNTVALFERVYQKHLSAIHTFQKVRQNPRLDDGEVIEIRDAINDYDDTTSEDTVQSLNNLIMVVDEGIGENELDTDTELAVDEEESCTDDDDETTQRHSPSTPSERPGLGMRTRLAAMLSETGLELEAKAPNNDRNVSRILGLTHGLIRFSVKPSKGIAFCPKPLFAVRVNLSKPGVPHPHRFLGDIKWYNSEDPCLRLGIQYRLLDNNDGRGASVNWEWASTSASDVGRKEFLERIYKANTFVELLENKTAGELVGIPRRSLESWYQARRPRQARSSRIEEDTPATPRQPQESKT